MANQYSQDYAAERAVAVRLLRRGEATVAEIANHFGLARQTVAVWARGIDVAKLRAGWIARKVEQARQ